MNIETSTEKNLYELLDVPPDASDTEIAGAYRKAQQVYGADSVAAYSLYSPEELEQLLEAISEAYETLSDPRKRSEYDRLVSSGEVPGQDDAGDRAAEPVLDIAAAVEDGYGSRASGQVATLRHPLIVMDESDSMATEQYRILFTKIDMLSQSKSMKVIAITSAVKGEGKTVTSLNLAYLMAKEFKKRVLLLECDLRKPSITTRYLEDGAVIGLVDVLRGEATPAEAMVRIEDSGLYVIPARHSVRNSTELLGHRRMRSLIDEMRADFDYVIIDTPPLLPLADVNVISRLVDGMLLVVRAGKTPRDIVKKGVSSIPESSIIGIVLNGAEMSFKKYYY
jgi:capsular exopolysaccharide synthesis family protein